MTDDRTLDPDGIIEIIDDVSSDPLPRSRRPKTEPTPPDYWRTPEQREAVLQQQRRSNDWLQRRLALDMLDVEAAKAIQVRASDMYDLSLPPGRAEEDLIEIARDRIGILAPYEHAFHKVSPEHWSGYDEHNLRRGIRGNMIDWRSKVEAIELSNLGWPVSAIAVWCYPYAYDVHLADTNDPRRAAAKCLELLSAEGRLPQRPEHDDSVPEGRHPESRRHRNPDMSDSRFLRKLDDAGRRLVTGDISGLASASDRTLIQANRKLTKRAVYGLIGIGKTAFDEYLGPKRCNIDWDTWKDDIERRYKKSLTAGNTD
jgi:hypothetical protein